MIHNDIEALYFTWLSTLAFPNEEFQKSYSNLLTQLYETPYKWDRTQPLDENRYVDGLNLRETFAYKTKLPEDIVYSSIEGPCSMLEMLCALGVRIDNDIMANTATGYDHGYYWIQEMMRNLGVLRYENSYWNSGAVATIISDFHAKNYSADGLGGLFYIPNSQRDLRTMNIWDQMCYYICRNYYEKENIL
jgi:hypothetical protein